METKSEYIKRDKFFLKISSKNLTNEQECFLQLPLNQDNMQFIKNVYMVYLMFKCLLNKMLLNRIIDHKWFLVAFELLQFYLIDLTVIWESITCII